MNEQNRKLVKFKRKYQNMWVAIDLVTGGVILSGRNLKRIADKMFKKKQDYILEKVPPLNSPFVFTVVLC